MLTSDWSDFTEVHFRVYDDNDNDNEKFFIVMKIHN